jgi:hypothetical protein
MKKKSGLVFFFSIIALILGKTLVKHFNFENLSFEKPWLDLLYAIIFAFSIYGIITNYKNKAEK